MTKVLIFWMKLCPTMVQIILPPLISPQRVFWDGVRVRNTDPCLTRTFQSPWNLTITVLMHTQITRSVFPLSARPVEIFHCQQF